MDQVFRERNVSTTVGLSQEMVTEDLLSRGLGCFAEINLKPIEWQTHTQDMSVIKLMMRWTPNKKGWPECLLLVQVSLAMQSTRQETLIKAAERAEKMAGLLKRIEYVNKLIASI